MAFEQVKSSLQALSDNLWGTIAKAILIAIVAFGVYVFIKYFRVFASSVGEAADEVARELDAVKVDAMLNPHGYGNTPSRSYLRTLLMVVLTIGKVLIVSATMFASFMMIEAHAVLPATVLCFLYGIVIGALAGYYQARGRLPWSWWLGGRRRGGGRVERVYLEKCVEDRYIY
jgi:cell division protein FtsX